MHFIKKILCKSECAEKGFQSRYNMLTRIVSLVMLFIMLPISIPNAAAAMEYRYIYLISKPTFRYTYNDDGMWALDTSTDKGVRMEKQGSYWVCTDYIPVTTQYTNETTPTLDLWDGTKFSYTGEAYPYDQDLAPIDDNTYYFAGNIRGGSSCEIATSEEQRDSFAGDGSPVADIEAPSRFNSGSTTYYIKPQISVSEAKKGNRLQTSNVSVFLFKSTKTLPGVYDPPESNVQADLEISTNNVYMNYKEFDVDGYVSTQVTFDPTGSTSTLDWDSYGIDGYSSKSDWNVSDSWNGPPEQQQFEVKYSKSDLGFNGFPGSVTDYISGEVVVSDGEKSDSASDEASVRLQFYNDGPMAVISSIKSTNLTSIGSSYDSTFYYVGEPIQITDASYDPENRQYDSYTDDPVVNYWVKYNGNNILVVNGMNASGVDYLDSYVESATVNGSVITATFKKAGYYTIGVQIQDEVGSWNETTKTIKVSGDPQPPTAVINSGNYTFVNYPLNVSDSSTDPNNDIVAWTWGKITSIDEEGNEVAANGVSGSLKGGTLPAGSTNKPSGIGGTLSFGSPGEYDIHLTVTDATKLSDEAVKTVKVIRDIPVAEIEPGPENSDNPSDSDPHYALDPEDELEKVYVKQNRKVELDASNSLSPPASPIQWEKTEWIYDASDTDPEFDLTTVNVDSSSTVKKQVFLAKEVGEFKITLTLHNEYSDALPDTDPDLAARTKTIIVKVLPDEPPVSTIQVDNMNPNFHDNPASVNVKVVATGKSLDNDFIDYYNWSLYRDNNNDGVYDPSTEELANRKGTNSTEITIPVKFESGNTSTFLGKVEAYERFGQETIDKFITADDIRMSSSEMEFEVNWRPCISYTMREFAYVDDTLTITPVLKDENVETCTVEWTLMKKNSAGEYEAIDLASVEANVFGDKPIWELGLHGGTIRITKDGYYRLDAVITDAEGHSEQFSSTEIRIYDVPHAVISDGAEFRWNGQAFQFKESRKFTLNGNSSYVDDSTGPAKHQIDRSLDEWTITPLDGQDASQIYVGTTADGTAKMSSTEATRFNPGRNSFDEVLAILEPGRYRVDYQVTNTYGKKSPITTQNIVIVEDTAPIIEGVVQPSVLRGSAENNAETVVSISNLNIYSDDRDIINTNWTVELIYDKNNDGFQNDSWQTVDPQYIDISRNEKYHVTMDIVIPESNLGDYQFKVYDKDIFAQETLPIVPESERKETTKTFDTEIDNVKPNGTFSTNAETKADVVFAFGSRSEKNQYTFGSNGNTLNSDYGEQTITLPAGTYQLECWGASGGSAQNGHKGGAGAYTTGEITLSAPSTVTVRVGEQGKQADALGVQPYNGGGLAWYFSGSGGGKTDITINGELVMVAAAGGGAGNGGADGGFGGDTEYGGSSMYPNGSECYNGANQKNSRTKYYSAYLGKYVDGSGNPHGEDFGHGGAGGGGGAGYVPGRSGGAFNNAGGGGGTSFLNSKLTNASAFAGNTSFDSPDGASETGHIGNGYAIITSLVNTSQAIEEVKDASKTFGNRFGGESGNSFDVNIETVETIDTGISSDSMDFDYVVNNWEKVGSNIWTAQNGVLSCSIPQIDWTGQYGGWSGTGILNDEAYDATDVKISFDLNAKKAALMEGPCWRVTKNSDGTYNGYFMNVSAHWGNLALMRFDHVSLEGSFTAGDLGGLVYCALDADHHGHGNKNPPTTGEVRVCDCNGHNATATFLSVCPSSRYIGGNYIDGKVEISMQGDHIVVTVDGEVLYDVVDNTYSAGTYGFWGNNCEQIASMQIKNLTVTSSKTNQKTLTDAISDVSWRDGAERFVVFTNEEILDYMSPDSSSDPYAYPKFLSSLLDANCHLILLGSNINEQQCRELIQQLNLSGLFQYVDPSSAALDSVETFIKDILRKGNKDTMYVLVNELLNYNKIYKDFNGDPQWIWTANGNTPYLATGTADYDELFQQFQDNPSILAQKWKYWHDADYYDNSQGLASFDQEWMAHEVNVFDKVGMYEIDYRIKDNPVPDKSDNSTGNPFDEYRYWSADYAADTTDSNGSITNPHAVVYVHRRPFAEFDFVAKKVNDIVDEIDITNNAYDLDHQYSDGNLGLNLFEWSWRFASDSSWRGSATFSSASEGEQWINSQLVGLRNLGMDNIIVQYRVRDIDGPAESETINITRKVGSNWVTSEETTVRNQGAWSLPTIRWITNNPIAPVARFDTNNTVFGLGENITVTDRSYSPNGDNIAQWQWTIERSTGTKTTITYNLNSNGITSVEKMEEQFSNYLTNWIDSQPIGTKADDNEYKITLIVVDDKPQKMTSDPYSVTVKITPENTAPTVKPNDPSDTDASVFAHDNPTVYEYDAYDANLTNPYYKYKGTVQYRGTETIDWSVALDDPDNHDKYGTGNDSGSYKLSFTLDRFLAVHRTDVAEGATGAQRINYPTKTVTSAQAAVSSNIAPFTSVQNGNVGWGAWRITTSVTDVPNNDSTPKTTEMVTHAAEKPLHLYVIPKLDVAAPHFSYDGVQDNQTQIPTGEVVTITTTTNDRSTGAKILYKDGDGSALEQEMVLVKTEGETKYWSADFVIPDNLEAEDLISGEYYPYQVETYTNYGSQAGEVTRAKAVDGAANIHILPIKLYDFTITGITDPSVVFGGDTTVRDLAYDRANSENGALMKLGYAFNFKVYSKGMKDSDDYVRIRPTFWGYNNATGRYDMPLDVYYLNDNDEYVLATTNPDNSAASGDDFTIKTQEFFGKTIGSIRELKLTSNFRDAADRNTQVWSARYGLPGTAVFVGKGGSLTETNMYLGDVLINFDIEAMKHGSAKYNYIGKGQWRIERTDGNENFLNPDKTKYEDGDIILLDGMNNAALDFESRPVWTKLQ